MNLDKKNVRRIRGLIIFTVVLFLGIQRFDVVLEVIEYGTSLIFPFALGACIAYVLSVPMRAIEKALFMRKRTANSRFWQKVKRPCSILITFILVIGVIAVVFFMLVPELTTTVISLSNEIPEFLKDAEKKLDDLFAKYPVILEQLEKVEFDWNNISSTVIDFVKNDLVNTLSSTFKMAKSIVSTVVSVAIAFFFSVYLLAQKETLGRQFKGVMTAFLKEKTKERLLKVFRLADETFSNFLSGQCIEAVILGTMFVVALTIFGFNYAVLIGVLIAFTALIPVFGPFVGCAIGTLLILIDNPSRAFWFLVLFLILQGIEETFIYPHVVGNAVGLPAIWVLVAVTVGGSTFGVAGMLFFIPLISVIYALFREYVLERLQKKEVKTKTETAQAITECAPTIEQGPPKVPPVEKGGQRKKRSQSKQ